MLKQPRPPFRDRRGRQARVGFSASAAWPLPKPVKHDPQGARRAIRTFGQYPSVCPLWQGRWAMDRRAPTDIGRLLAPPLRRLLPGGLPVVLGKADLHTICNDSVEECRSAHPASTIVLETVGDV